MQKIFIIAMFAICSIFPGKIDASSTSNQQIQFELMQEVDPVTADRVLQKLAQMSSLDYQTLCDQYRNGGLIIETYRNGYQVSDRSSDGGGFIAIIENI